MTIQAKWKNRTFEVSNDKANSISVFTITSRLNIEEKKSKSGTSKVTVKGLKPEELQINFNCGFSAGTDPRQENQDFQNLAGQIGEFYLGNQKLGRGAFILDEASMNNALLSNTGRIYHAEHSLKFSQYIASSKKQTAKKKNSNGASLKEINEAKSALGIRPSVQDKKSRASN